jgi:hypothetical protein
MIYKTYNDIGTTKILYNGLGYDSEKAMFYAAVKESGTDDYGNSIDIGDLISVDRFSGKIKLIYDGDTTAGSSVKTTAGDFYNGKWYYQNVDDKKHLYSWDRETNTTQQIGSTRVLPADFGIVPATGYAYGARTYDTTSGAAGNTKFYVINLSDGSVTTYTITVTTPDGGDLDLGWGAAFVANGDTLYLANNDGYIYRIDGYDTSTPTATFIYRSGVTDNNDGASCANANQFPPDSDGDGIADYLDLDSDNDGIPDNVEAQATDKYTAPSGTDADGDGLDDTYDANTNDATKSVGLIPPDTDGDITPDMWDSDSDNDGYSDCEEGNTNADCANITVGDNGLASWAENSDDYSDVNGNLDNANDAPEDLFNETGDKSEMGYREFLCGKALTTLTERNWKLISIPCDTDIQNIQALFGDNQLGNYGEPSEGGTWVMYKQSATPPVDSATDDNYEINASHPNTNKVKLTGTSTLVQGASYWIIWDDGDGTPGETIDLTIDRTLSSLSPTSTVDTSTYGIDDPDFSEVYKRVIPNNEMTRSDTLYKKFMAGNPFPYAFRVENLYFSHGGGSGSFYPMGDTTNDTYINATFYKHDAPNIGPITGYTAINPATPGFDEGGIKPMEGFFVKNEKRGSTVNAVLFNDVTVPTFQFGNVYPVVTVCFNCF